MKTIYSMALVGLLFTVAVVETNLNKESPEQAAHKIEQEQKDARKIDEIKAKILQGEEKVKPVVPTPQVVAPYRIEAKPMTSDNYYDKQQEAIRKRDERVMRERAERSDRMNGIRR